MFLVESRRGVWRIRPSKMLNPRKFSFGATSAVVTSMGMVIGLGAAGVGAGHNREWAIDRRFRGQQDRFTEHSYVSGSGEGERTGSVGGDLYELRGSHPGSTDLRGYCAGASREWRDHVQANCIAGETKRRITRCAGLPMVFRRNHSRSLSLSHKTTPASCSDPDFVTPVALPDQELKQCSRFRNGARTARRRRIALFQYVSVNH